MPLWLGLTANLFGAPWAGALQPAPIPIPIPFDRAFVGANVFVQGVMLDVLPAANPAIGLTTGLRLMIGS